MSELLSQVASDFGRGFSRGLRKVLYGAGVMYGEAALRKDARTHGPVSREDMQNLRTFVRGDMAARLDIPQSAAQVSAYESSIIHVAGSRPMGLVIDLERIHKPRR